jgi:hypothetical protein
LAVQLFNVNIRRLVIETSITILMVQNPSYYQTVITEELYREMFENLPKAFYKFLNEDVQREERTFCM